MGRKHFLFRVCICGQSFDILTLNLFTLQFLGKKIGAGYSCSRQLQDEATNEHIMLSAFYIFPPPVVGCSVWQDDSLCVTLMYSSPPFH